MHSTHDRLSRLLARPAATQRNSCPLLSPFNRVFRFHDRRAELGISGKNFSLKQLFGFSISG
jgi:hypothetical protein